MTNSLRFFNKRLMTYDEKIGKYVYVSPRILTSTVFDKHGVCLDDLLNFDPTELRLELIKMIEDLKGGVPEAYDTLIELADGLSKNKNSITEILTALNKRVKIPHNPIAGYILKLDDDLNIVFAPDNDTVYEHPPNHDATMILEDESHRFVKDEQVIEWNNKIASGDNIDDNLVTIDGVEIPISNEFVRIARLIKELQNLKGAVNGLAELDESGKIPEIQIPDIFLTDAELKNYLEDNGYAKTSDIKTIDLSNYVSLDDTGKISKGLLPDEALKDTIYNDTEVKERIKTLEDKKVAELDENDKIKIEKIPLKDIDILVSKIYQKDGKLYWRQDDKVVLSEDNQFHVLDVGSREFTLYFKAKSTEVGHGLLYHLDDTDNAKFVFELDTVERAYIVPVRLRDIDDLKMVFSSINVPLATVEIWDIQEVVG